MSEKKTRVDVWFETNENGDREAIFRPRFNVGKVHNIEEGKKTVDGVRYVHVPMGVPGMLRTYESAILNGFEDMDLDARQEWLEVYKSLLILDACGVVLHPIQAIGNNLDARSIDEKSGDFQFLGTYTKDNCPY